MGANKWERKGTAERERERGYGYAEVKRNNFWARTAKRPRIICKGAAASVRLSCLRLRVRYASMSCVKTKAEAKLIYQLIKVHYME